MVTREELSAEIKKADEEGKLVIGAERVIKELRKKNIAKVYTSSNPRKELADEVRRNCRITGISYEAVEWPNDELGVICKKPFNISILGILK